MDDFATNLLLWFDHRGRKDLPWQREISPYRVWVSEIMLQQTQVATVIPYFERFMARFPSLIDLASAELDEVLHYWTGLGYYARGRNLHKAARVVMADHQGELPGCVEGLQSLPGIGQTTAGAIAAIAFEIRAPILDGNVKRVLTRFHAIAGYPGETAVARKLWRLADQSTPSSRVADYTQAIMDLGATVCVRNDPDCHHCPIRTGCAALTTGAVDAYPGKRPGKDKPVRAARLFVLHDGRGGCLLEQRPENGIWGGLWTPPERAADFSSEEFLCQFGLQDVQPNHTRRGATFRHTFTHFHLDIEPIYIEISDEPRLIRERDDARWYQVQSAEPLGLSAPAVKLLASLSEISPE